MVAARRTRYYRDGRVYTVTKSEKTGVYSISVREEKAGYDLKDNEFETWTFAQNYIVKIYTKEIKHLQRLRSEIHFLRRRSVVKPKKKVLSTSKEKDNGSHESTDRS